MTEGEKDPQEFLPAGMSVDWAVIPKKSLTWLAIQCLALGAGVALTFGSYFGAGWVWGLPVALGVMFLVALPMRRREARAISRLPGCPREGDGGLSV